MLLALPPARFTAERSEVARALAARGDPAAAAVRRLRRPVGLAWVLNRLSRDHPREVRGLLEAGDRLRAGQRRAVSGAGAAALREAEAGVRERARALRLEAERLLSAAGRAPAATTLARVELLLRVAASGPAREDLGAGTLAREPEVGDAGLSGLTLLSGGGTAPAPDPAPAAAPKAPAPSGPRRSARAAARETREREQAERRRAAQEARDTERRRRERDRAVKAAHGAAAKAAKRAEVAERAAARADSAARDARERAAAARTEASRLAARALEVERTLG